MVCFTPGRFIPEEEFRYLLNWIVQAVAYFWKVRGRENIIFFR